MSANDSTENKGVAADTTTPQSKQKQIDFTANRLHTQKIKRGSTMNDNHWLERLQTLAAQFLHMGIGCCGLVKFNRATGLILISVTFNG